MNYLNKTLLILITAFQVSAMAQISEIQLLIQEISSPHSLMNELIVAPLKGAENTRKNEFLLEFAQILKSLNNASLNIFGKDLSSDFIDAIKATIKKIIRNPGLYKSPQDNKNPYPGILEEEVFDGLDTKSFHDLFMYFQLWFRTDSSMNPYAELSSEKKELIHNQSELFKTIYKYFLLVYEGVTIESFYSYIQSSNLEDSNLFNEALRGEVDKIVELAKQKRAKILNPRDDTEE